MKNERRLFFSTFLIAFCAAIFAGCAGEVESNAPVETVPTAELVRQADALYALRAENLQKAKDGLQLLRRARAADGNNYEAAWKIAKYNYFVGNNAKDPETRDKAFAEGVKAGKTAARLAPDKADGYFWTGACLGGQAQASALDGAANIPEIRENMNRVIEIEPAYQGAMAYVALAQIELKTRGILGGDANKAAALLETALKLEKQNSFIYVTLAEAYFYLNRQSDAKRMLAELRRMPPNVEYAAEQRENEEKARKLEARF